MTLRRAAVWVGVCAVLLAVFAAVFAAYLRPDVMVTLANQLWNCF